MPVCAKVFDLLHEELRIKVGGEMQVFFVRGHLNDVGDIYSVLCHSHHIKAEANRLLGLVPYFLEDLGHHILVGLSPIYAHAIQKPRELPNVFAELIADGSMHIVVGDLQEKRVLGLPQNMLERGGLPSGLHANESHHAILAKTSVDGWEVKVY